jgi:RNA polymerase sigma-70 factor (ECF subfamily)
VIYRYLARRVGSAADDLVADTFVAAFVNRARYDPSYADARPWLYGIASKELSRYFRAEHREHRRLAGGSLQAVAGHASQVASDATAEALRDDLEVALSSLAQGDRDVLVLVAWEELTYSEVARALEIPIGTVRSRLHRARSQLRLVLDQLIDQETIKEVLTNE